MPPLKVALKSLSSRLNVRTNSAAEFVELRAGPSLLDDINSSGVDSNTLVYDRHDVPEFDPISDQFLDKEQLDM
jgi:hypothetical protein